LCQTPGMIEVQVDLEAGVVGFTNCGKDVSMPIPHWLEMERGLRFLPAYLKRSVAQQIQDQLPEVLARKHAALERPFELPRIARNPLRPLPSDPTPIPGHEPLPTEEGALEAHLDELH